METTLFRAFVLMLSLTGFTATTVSTSKATAPRASANVDTIGNPPACPPWDPNKCGID